MYQYSLILLTPISDELKRIRTQQPNFNCNMDRKSERVGFRKLELVNELNKCSFYSIPVFYNLDNRIFFS